MSSKNLMRFQLFTTLVFVLGLLIRPCFGIAQENQRGEFTAEEIEFFENRIRPLLIDQCVKCHGDEKQESGFRADSRNAILAGGVSDTPGALGGNPVDSLIIQSVRHESDYDMPPTGKLSDQQIADLTRWVELGLPWPDDAEPITQSLDQRMDEHRKSHWSFQPIESFPDDTSIDSLLGKKLLKAGLAFSSPATKRKQIRRATFDLIGLPPSFEEVESFANDDDPAAYAKLIDGLLERPEYGERWARHWLDVARYADTLGYALAEEDREYPFAYTYRDYVINAFNQDLPFDQFVVQQLAGDQLDVPANDSSLAALGFITVGRKFLNQVDTIDDRVDVVTRGLMGLTVSCARCHDHKFDAVSTQDYYSLYGVFYNCQPPSELPLIGEIPESDAAKAYFKELEALEKELQDFLVQARAKVQHETMSDIRQYAMAIFLWDDMQELESRKVIQLVEMYLNVIGRMRSHWQTISFSQEDTTNGKFLRPYYRTLKNETSLDKKIEAVNELSDELERIVEKWKSAGAPDDAMSAFEDDDDRERARILFADGSPFTIPAAEAQFLLNGADQKTARTKQANIQKHHAKTPFGVDRAMVVVDKANLEETHVMIRGNEGRPGELAPRRFLALLEREERETFSNGAGRLELARKIVDPENPLTARVIVNRIWMHHFSQPLVDTPSDFGIRCDEPIQRELLDFLAGDLIRNGWSIKSLHRKIMLSRAYQQSSQHRREAAAVDPENRLLWRMNPRRLEFEALRDSMLAVSGELDLQRGGRGNDQFVAPFDVRRSIYGRINRQELPGVLRVFDLASPDQSAAKRLRTVVPQQSLFLMNSEFVIQQSVRIAEKISVAKTSEEQVVKLFRTVLSREPTGQERVFVVGFLTRPPLDEPIEGQLSRLEQACQVLLMANEFEIID